MTQETSNIFRRLALPIVMLLIAAAGAIAGSKYVIDRGRSDIMDELQSITSKNARYLNSALTSRLQLIRNAARITEASFAAGESLPHILSGFMGLADVYGLKRIGFASESGIVTTTDGYNGRIPSFASYYAQGMAGRESVTDTVIDNIHSPAPINIFGVPVHAPDGTISGVLFGTYETTVLGRQINSGFMDMPAAQLIVNSRGDIIYASSSYPFKGISRNLIDYVGNSENAGNISGRITAALNEGISRRFSFSRGGEKILYLEPIPSNATETRWHFAAIVPLEAIDERIAGMSGASSLLAAAGVTLTMVSILYLLFSFSAQRRRLEKQLFTDRLTGGTSYAGFKQRMRSVSSCGHLVSADIREFKIINSVCGTEGGDRILRLIWTEIRKSLRLEEYAGRVFADRFVMYLATSSSDAVRERLAQLSRRVADSTSGTAAPAVSLQFGATQWAPGMDLETSYTHAFMAKGQASSDDGKKNDLVFFSDSQLERSLDEKRLVDGFPEALAARRFEVWFQSKHAPYSGAICGAEALVRWRTRSGILLAPDAFIPVFEKRGLIRTLDEYVFRSVCRMQQERTALGLPVVPVSVNLSRASMYSGDIVESLLSILRKSGIPPSLVPLEITETAVSESSRMKELADSLCEKGFQLHMDDFGSGYSSLSVLDSLHFSILKIDKSLIDHIGTESGDRLLRHTFSLASELGLGVTAEGVETQAQADFLARLGCGSMQGYLFARPAPAEDFFSRLNAGMQSDLPPGKPENFRVLEKPDMRSFASGTLFGEIPTENLIGPMGIYRINGGKAAATAANRAFLDLLGLLPQDFSRPDAPACLARVHPDDERKFLAMFETAERTPLNGARADCRFMNRSGRPSLLSMLCLFLRHDAGGSLFCIRIEDVNEIPLSTELLMNSSILKSISEGMFIMCAFDLANGSFIEYGSGSPEDRPSRGAANAGDRLGMMLRRSINPAHLEKALRFTDLGTLPSRMGNTDMITEELLGLHFEWIRMQFNTVRQGKTGPDLVLFTARTVSRESRREQDLIRLSCTDALTGLYNRRSWDEIRSILDASPLPSGLAVVSMDVNGLKYCNDVFGHEAGDELLRSAASCFEKAFAVRGRCYRIGGDEFAALVFAEKEELLEMTAAFRMLTACRESAPGRQISAAVGYAEHRCFPMLDIPALLRIADSAMYNDKREYYGKR